MAITTSKNNFSKNHAFSIEAINHEGIFHGGYTAFLIFLFLNNEDSLRLYLEAITEKSSLKNVFFKTKVTRHSE